MPVVVGGVVGGVVEVAPAPWPDAPVVPGLPVPLWLVPEVPIVPLAEELPDVDPVAELPMSLPFVPLVPIPLHAARDSAVMLPMRMP